MCSRCLDSNSNPFVRVAPDGVSNIRLNKIITNCFHYTQNKIVVNEAHLEGKHRMLTYHT